MFKTVNLKAALIAEREASNNLLASVYQLLKIEADHEERISNNLKRNNKGESYAIDLKLLDTDQIFNQSVIEKLCINYRLRFLDSQYFTGELPQEAISKIKQLETKTGQSFQNFKIIAPAKRFKLADANEDPLLLLPLTDGNYYLIHQWGNDMPWHRKLMAYPMRNMLSLFTVVFALSVLLSFIVPSSWFIPYESSSIMPFRMLLFVYFFFASSAVVAYLGFLFFKDFSANEWSSKYFN